jgi:two-component system chemotaxis sensor kinase CheA
VQSNPWERRCQAAEKTVQVLKKKVRELYNDGAQTSIHKQLERARRRDEKNQQRQQMMELRQAELQSYSERLEGEVAARTRELRTILDNVTFGFLLIDQDLKVQKGWTESCHSLLNTQEDITGADLCALLGLSSEKDCADYWLAVDQVFEDLLPEEVSLEQMPNRFSIGDKVLRVEGRTIRHPDNQQVVGLLMTIGDITDLEAAERESHNNKVILSLLRRRDAFRAFLHDTRNQLHLAQQELDQVAYVRRVVHTIKGNAASYGLDTVASMIHHIEDRPSLGHADLQEIEGALRAWLDRYYEYLELSWDDLEQEQIQISNEQLEDLKRMLAQSDQDHPDLHRWTAQITQKPAGVLLGPVQQLVERLSERLEKSIKFTLEGSEVEVNPDVMLPLFQTLGHLLRNAIDHGIEPAWQRGHKPATGHIKLRVSKDRDNYYIDVQDDGGGIDQDAVIQRAMNLGLTTPEEVAQMTPSQKNALIFRDGLSTRGEANEISGRGVGMSAVMGEVHRCYGDIEVNSTRGEGTCVRLRIPRPRLVDNPSEVARDALKRSDTHRRMPS